ncbi:FkbM family methyltransferase [Pedobacter frigiditerrae]|uniref:FkbM family methyltransferase n=1 Tax=Pedobacter frigiditerrae TaxID=2530452 RepID=A0A4V2MIY5_9SPHI|nr:FkbM family methyltransferase [Pedobacter frigiditerrae]TCC92256.1 FkbM family methyltransferase [Pedobacter frigiditerrae]
MEWKYIIGNNFSKIDQAIIKSGLNSVYKHYPFGRHWIFDLKRILKLEPIVMVDAGANIGSVSKELNYWFPSAYIYAFEPVKSTFDLLVKQTSSISNIYPEQLALGANSEKIELALNPENTINSLKVKNLTHMLGKEVIEVIRLDEFVKNNSLDTIDILKIDVEGFEFEVLEGCGNVDINCILIEVGYERELTKVHFSDVENYMEKLGFQLIGIYEIMRNLNDRRKIAYSNNLYIKRALINS